MPVKDLLEHSVVDYLNFASVVGTSYFFFGNAEGSLSGVVPAVAANPARLTDLQKVKLWHWFYDSAKMRYAPIAALSFVSAATAAYLSNNKERRITLLASGLLSFFAVPWTLIVIKKVNDKLIEISNGNLEEKAKRESRDLLLAWKQVNAVRYGVSAISLALSYYSLLNFK